MLRPLGRIFASRSLEVAALFTAAASLLTGILIARLLGPSGRGHVVIIATWGQAIAWAGSLSIDKALMARSSVDGRRQASVPLATGLWAMLLIGGVVALGSASTTRYLLLDDDLRLALGVAILGTVATDARAAHLLYSDRWREYALLRFAQPAVYLMGCCGAAAFAQQSPSMGAGLVVTALCASLWAPAILVGGLPRPRLHLPHRAQIKSMFAFAGAYHVGSVLSFLTSRIDLMAVTVRFGLVEVGLYSVAASLGQLAALFGSANLMRGINGKLKSSSFDWAGLAAATTLTGLVALCTPWLLHRVYGPEFVAAGALTPYLCLGGLLFYLRQGANGQLTGLGRPWATAWANGSGVVGFLAMMPLANTTTQIAAAATIATAASTAVSFVLLHFHSPRPGRGVARTPIQGSPLPVTVDAGAAPAQQTPRMPSSRL